MTLVRWNPLRDLNLVQNQVNRVFEDFFGSTSSDVLEAGFNKLAVDVKEEKDKYLIKAELPGVDKKDVDVNLDDGLLTISAEKKSEKKDDKDDYHYQEVCYGKYQRTLRLPDNIKEDSIKADLTDGVLKLTLPKSEEAKKKTRKIEIK